MCIRDRDNLVKGAVDILDVRFGSLWTSITREEFNHLSPEFGERFEAVSYTHLDVYKRQIQLTCNTQMEPFKPSWLI